MDYQIILDDGTQVDLAHGIAPDYYQAGKLSAHFAIREAVDHGDGSLVITGLSIQIAEDIRDAYGKALWANSWYRSLVRQARLLAEYLAKGQTAMTFEKSVHCYGMAVDLSRDHADHQTTPEEALAIYNAVRMVNHDKYGGKLRVGYEEYKNNGYNFVHCDCAPLFYAPGQPWASREHNSSWALPGCTW